MKAIYQERYGSPDVLQLRELETPVPGTGQVLVRVRAASVNALDDHFLRGWPYVARPALGLRRPKFPVRGADLAGTVEAVGANVLRLKPGDEVFGQGHGTFAEYALDSEEHDAGNGPHGANALPRRVGRKIISW